MTASGLTSALPPLAAALVSADVRLAYVLRHFALAYETVPEGLIGYAGSGSPIEVAAAADSFFQEQQPYPATPSYREWAGRLLPFFFDNQPEAPLLAYEMGRARISVDLISAAFYLLSGWQEYFSDARDRHGRFPYKASVQQRYGFVAVPIVNYYFEVLRTAVEHVSGQFLQPRRWADGAPFAAFISHDIDNLRSSWKAPAKAALQRGQLGRFGQRLWWRLTRPDAWDNLEQVAAAVASYGARSTFFILPEHRPGADGTPNADYELSERLSCRFQALHAQGFELAFHGSIGTATDSIQFERERETLQQRLRGVPYATGLRFHYLRWSPRHTLGHLEHSSAAYDSTLGFAEHYGFRHSYCHPFYPFNFETGQASSVLEIPLQVMDATLHHPNYLQLQPEEILPALQPLFAEVEKFGGVASILWHNDHFDPANTITGPRQFADIMAYLQQRGVAFRTGSQIVAELCGA